MTRKNDDLICRLTQYADYLEARIKVEQESLAFVTPTRPPKNPDLVAAMQQPIIRTITAYQDAIRRLCYAVPELERKYEKYEPSH